MIDKKYLQVQPSRLGGLGLFTIVNLKKNLPIIEFVGDLFNNSNKPNTPDILQIGNDTFLGLSGGQDDHVNHSCDPNCYLHIVGNRAMLYALYDINSGTELTFDYSTSSTDSLDTWQMDCNCGTFNCRKTISGFKLLSSATQKSMNTKGIIPLFMRDPIFR